MRKMFIFCCLLFVRIASAQTLEVEKMHELSKRAKRGYLYHVNSDASTGNVDLVFITSQNAKRIKLEIYTFDKDYNLLDQRQEEQEIENNSIRLRLGKSDVNIKVKYREPIITEGISVEASLTGTLILRKKRTTWKWNVFWQAYEKKVETLEKLKPRTEDGDKYLLVSHYEDDFTGDAVILATPKNEYGFKKMVFMRYNKDLDLVAKKEIDYPYAVKTFYKSLVTEPNPNNEDIEIVKGAFFMLAPTAFGGKNKKAPKDKTNEFEIVKIDNSLQNIIRVPFKASTSLWQIQDVYQSKDSYYFYGLAADTKGKYFDQIINPNKFKSIQLMKFNDLTNQVDFITNTNLEEMKAKIKTPPAQKRKPVFKGSSFSKQIATLTPENEFFLSGQNYRVTKKGVIYEDIIGLHFDTKGVLKAMYSVDPIENNKYAKANSAPQYILEGASGENMYWVITEIDGFDSDDNRLEYYPRIAKISKKDISIGNFLTVGVLNKKKFYLDKKYPFFSFEPNKTTFFGSTSNGKYIYFGRVKFD